MTRYSSILYTPTISVSSGVATNEVLSATEAIGSVEGGWLESIHLYNLANITRGITLYILGADGSVGAESSGLVLSDALAQTVLSRIVFSSGNYIDFGNSLYQMLTWGDTGTQGLGLWLQAITPSTDPGLYAAITVNSTGTKFTTSGIKLRFNFRH